MLRLIENDRDIADFLEQVNYLHDGYLLSVQFDNTGYIPENPRFLDPEKTTIRFRIMVTSIHDTIVEIVFENIREWQIREPQYNEILDSAVTFTDDGFLIWTDNDSTAQEVRAEGSYVIAKSMKWQIV